MIKLVKGKKHITDLITNKVILKHRKKIRKALMNYGSDIVRELERVHSGSRSGRLYMIRGVSHRASAPGEPPASVSGKLAKSYRYKASMRDLTVGSTAFSSAGSPYPKFLESGTSKMKPRPWFDKTNRNSAYILQRDLQEYDL